MIKDDQGHRAPVKRDWPDKFSGLKCSEIKGQIYHLVSLTDSFKHFSNKEENEKAGLKLSIQNTRIMASSSITSWQIDVEKVETVTDFIFLGSKITVDSDCSHEILMNKINNKILMNKPWTRCLFPGRKAMTDLESIFKSRNVTLSTKIHIVKTMVFPLVVYGCESWTLKKAECQRIHAFELWCWRRLLRVPWTARRSNQSILKEISPEYSLEGLMLKLQYFGHLMQRADSLEKILMLRKLRAGGEGGDRGWDGWMASLIQWTWVWASSGRWWGTGKPGVLQSLGSQWFRHDSDWTTTWILFRCQMTALPFQNNQVVIQVEGT